MVKTVVIPDSNTLHLSIPNDYIGKEIEVLLYSKDELTEKKPTRKNNAAFFKGLLSAEEADKYQEYLNQARDEWSRDI